MSRATSVAVGALLVQLAAGSLAEAETAAPATCRDDAMIVFDASSSMAGTDLNSPPSPRIAKVKAALSRVLPSVAATRNLGLIDYGPGPYNQCDNIELQLRPTPNAAARIMSIVDSLVPAGRTPLTLAVREAANVLDFPVRPAVVVLLTDGEETCGGDPAGRTPLTLAVREAANVLDFPVRPAVVVLLTDGEETCGGDPCGLARMLGAKGRNLTVHVISYRSRDSTEVSGIMSSRCLAAETGGLYISAETTDELAAAFQKTLGCPFVSQARVLD